MGTPGHMQHPFDIPEVRTGNDLVSYFNKIVEYVTQNPPSIKFDGINVSFKLVQNEDGSRDFRMDRGTSHIDSVVGLTAQDAYKKWPAGHGMPPAIEDLLNIFNRAIPLIEPELKKLGMWDDPTKFFNTEYMKKGRTNVIEYPEPILAIHGINQFYQKRAQAWRVRSGQSMDRPGLPRPVDPETKKPIKHSSTEITYDKAALRSLIEKVAPIARQIESANAPNGYAMVGDVPANLVGEIDFSEALSQKLPVTVSEGQIDERTLGEWLQVAINPAAPPSPDLVTLTTGKTIWAHSKDVYVNILNKVPLDQYLANPEEDSGKAVSGAVFNHATRLLGNVVKSAFDSQFGNAYDHEGLVIRGLEFRPLKVTGDFVLDSLATTFRDPVNEVVARTVNAIRSRLSLSQDKEKALLRKIMGTKESVSFIGNGLTLEEKRHVADLLINSESITGERIYVIKEENDISKVELEGHSTIALVPGGFKPPHIGHFEMVKDFASKADRVYIIMGSGGKTPRTINGNKVTYDMSSKIWEMYMSDAGIENYTLVEVEEGEKSRVTGHKASPMQIAYDIMQLDTRPKQTVIMGASTKDAGRFRGYAEKYVPTDEEGNPKINLEVEEFPAYTIPAIGPNGETVEASASIMRSMIENNNFDSFKQLLPETSRNKAEEIWNTLSGDSVEMKEKKTFGASQLFSLVEQAMDERANLLLEKNYAGVTGKRFYTDPKNWKVPKDENEAVRLAIDISDEELGARSGFEKFAGRLKGFMPGRAAYTGQSSQDHDQMQKAIYDELLALRAQFDDREYERYRRGKELEIAKAKARAEADEEFEREMGIKRSIAQSEYERDLKGRQAQYAADRKKEYYKKYPERAGKVLRRNRWGVSFYDDPDASQRQLGIDEKKMTKGDKNRETRLKKKMDKDPSIKKDFKKRYGKDGESVYFATIRKQAMKKDEEIELDEAELEEISAAGAGGGSVEGASSGKKIKRNSLIHTN
jgi:hypothetical protein